MMDLKQQSSSISSRDLQNLTDDLKNANFSNEKLLPPSLDERLNALVVTDNHSEVPANTRTLENYDQLHQWRWEQVNRINTTLANYQEIFLSISQKVLNHPDVRTEAASSGLLSVGDCCGAVAPTTAGTVAWTASRLLQKVESAGSTCQDDEDYLQRFVKRADEDLAMHRVNLEVLVAFQKKLDGGV